MNKMIFKLALLTTLVLTSCAQKEMAVSTTSDASQTATAAEQKISKAYEEQWDVLSQDELSKAEAALKDAKKDMADNDDMETISKDFAKFDDHYSRALALADARSPKVQGLLNTRRQVINTGARKYTDENKTLTKLDNKFRSLSEKKIVDASDYSELQNEYMQLRNKVTKKHVLQQANSLIDDAKKNKAKKYAPRSLNKAELDLKNAENTIDANINQPEIYSASVRSVNRSAAMLAAVVAEQKKVNYNLDETAAVKLVEQSGQIDRMNFDLAMTNSALAETRQDLAYTEEQANQNQAEVNRKNQLLMAAENNNEAQARKLLDQQANSESEKRFQASLLSAQKQFSKSEADVFRQGDKILIRLKTFGFATGKTDIPEKSKPLLERVTAVAEKLEAKQIVVEGHTDSVGNATINQEISQKRAESVMSYLANEGVAEGKIQAVGYGFQKPLSTNKTKVGREQNRRVDVWITPSDTTKTE